MIRIQSFNGKTLDAAKYTIVAQVRDNKLAQSVVSAEVVLRGKADPLPAPYTRQENYIVLSIELTVAKDDVAYAFDELVSIFDVDDDELHSLIGLDDDDVEWEIEARPTQYVIENSYLHKINLQTMTKAWSRTAQSSDTWNITASGQTHVISTNGNRKVRPVFEFTPSVNKGWNGFLKRYDYLIYNRQAKRYNGDIYSRDITEGGLNTSTLVADTSKSNQINQGGGITAVATTIPIDTAVGGGLPSIGMGYIDSEQIAWTGNTGTQLTGVTRGIGSTVAATHADNAVIKRSWIKADGSDVRVYLNDVSIPYWLSTTSLAGSSATKIWINLDLSPKQEFVLATAIASSGSISAIEFKKTASIVEKMQALPDEGELLIDSERFIYTDKDVSKRKVTGITRAARGSSMASHSVGGTIRWIEHNIILAFGNETLEASEQDESMKPLLNLSSSTNTSWVLSEFADETGLRANAWVGSVISSTGGESNVYTGSYGAAADPATEMGMSILAWQQSGAWRGETAKLSWIFSLPCGFTTVTSSGAKYRSSTEWASKSGLQKSKNGKDWETVFNEATPGSTGAWAAWTRSSVSLSGTYQFLRFIFFGTISAKADHQISFEVQSVTLTLDSGNTPVGTLVGDAVGPYELDAKITNETNGLYFRVHFVMRTGQTLRIDCAQCKVKYLKDNSDAFGAISIPAEFDWMLLEPGDNTLTYEDDGTGTISLVTKWYEQKVMR
jgi:hypothetical protein